jgi:toxin ParE1/3/4
VPVLEWREAARADLLAIIDYISDDNPEAAQQLKDNIEAKVAKLAERPRLYRPGRVAGTREMVVRRNYVVVYAEDARAVSILRVLHAAQLWPPTQESGRHIQIALEDPSERWPMPPEWTQCRRQSSTQVHALLSAAGPTL